MWRQVIWATMITCFYLPATYGRAESPASQDDLTALALAAQGDVRPITADDVARRKDQLREAMSDLELLNTWDEAEETDWKSYLKWDELRQQLDAETPDLKALLRLRSLYLAQKDGLELPQFRGVCDAMTEYVYPAAASSQPNFREAVDARLGDLAKRLEAYEQGPSQADAIQIGRTLGWLEQYGQAEELVAAVRHRYWQPNLFAQVSQRILAAGFEDDVHEVEQVSQTIMGTRMRGTAAMDGRINLSLVPNDDLATLGVQLLGEAKSNNVGWNGPVTVYSTGVTKIDATAEIHVDADGVHASGATAWCSTNSIISRICARCGMVRKIAWKRARRTKSQAERIGSRKAAWRVEQKFDARATEMIQDPEKTYTEKIRNPLLRRDAFPKVFRFRTTAEHLFVKLMSSTPHQMAAPGQPPELNGDHDLALRLHDSAVGNLAESLLGGETLTDERLVEMLADAEAEIPDELQISEEKDPWSITFSQVQPISINFAEAGVTVAIEGARFTRGDRTVNGPIRISATYQVEQTPDLVRLIRQGDVEVEYPNLPRLSTLQVAMKTFLRKKFAALFTPDIDTSGLKPSGRLERIGTMQISQLDIAQGWLAVGLRQSPDGESLASVPPRARTTP